MSLDKPLEPIAPPQTSNGQLPVPAVSLPNALSTARLLGAAPVGLGLLLNPSEWSAPLNVLMATDIADGAIARHMGIASETGAWLDRLGDRVLGVSVSAAALLGDVYPGWLKSVMFAQKGYTATAVVRSRLMEEQLPHNNLAKASHVVRSLGMAGMFAAESFRSPRVKNVVRKASIGAILVSAATSVVVTTQYHKKLSSK